MVDILVTRRHSYTVTPPPGWPSNQTADIVRALPYDIAARKTTLPPACYIFGDIDRLSTSARKVASELHGILAGDPRCTVLNDPDKSLTRLALLHTLEKAGINNFRARPLGQVGDLRFPVFIREQDDHGGLTTPLLYSTAEVNAFARKLFVKGLTRRHLIVIEFFDASDEQGIFTKYAAFRIGDWIVPRHVFFSRAWQTKHTEIVTEETIKQERDYIETNPHEEMIKPIFELAGIQYGRMDYAIRDGRVVVWEINTNPMLGRSPRQRSALNRSLREPAKRIAISHLRSAFMDIHKTAGAQGEHIPLQIRRSVGVRMQWEDRVQEARRSWGRLVIHLAGVRRWIKRG